MPTILQLRRGTTAQNDNYAGSAGEITVDSTLNTLRVHDGSTAGGTALPTLTGSQTLTNKTLDSATTNVGAVNISEFVSDTVGAMVSGNTESGISVTYQDADNTLDFSLTATGVSAGSYGSASLVPIITVDAQGRVTAASTTSVAGVSSFSWNSSTETLTIGTADGGSFDADISGMASETYVNTADSALQAAIDTKLASASYTAADVLTKIKTVDGAGSGLDADLLDGQSSAYYATAASVTAEASARTTGDSTTLSSANTYTDTAISNLVNGADAAYDTLKEIQDAMATDAELSAAIAAITVGNATQTISAGSGMTGGGSFTANQTSSSSVTISHADTSTQTSLTALTGANVVSDIDVDGFGHVTALATRTMTLADLGYTGATNANYITNNNQLTNGAGYVTSSGVTSVAGTAPVVSSGGATPTISMAAATASVNGYMTSTYASKLDGIAAGAQVNVATNLSTTANGTSLTVASSTGTNASIPAATTTAWGAMTDEDKTKLDGIATGATNVTNTNQLTNGAGYITSSASISGNAATATALQTARTINGVSFNGTANIVVESYIEDDESTNATRYITFVDNSTAAYKRLNEDSTLNYNPSTGTLAATIFSGTATSARYADLAEKYTSDLEYSPGTVVVFGGQYEVTESTKSHDSAVAGVVSTNPAYLMNSELKEGVAVALTGRVPCIVKGPVNKGTVLVTSDVPGAAEAINYNKFFPGVVIGKSLEEIEDDSIKTIEIAVGRF